MKNFIPILAFMLIVNGCSGPKVGLTELQKSNLLVEAESIKFALCDSYEGKKFYQTYSEFLETQDDELEEEIRTILDEEWVQKVEDRAKGLGVTNLEAENFKLQAQEIAQNIDFFDPGLMNGLAELMNTSMRTFSWDCSD